MKRPSSPSSILPLSSVIKDAFAKFQHDFNAANLSEGKYVKPPPSTSKWYRVGQPCFQDKIQELNTDFAKICITPKFPCQFSRSWNIRLDKISQPSILPLPLQKLRLRREAEMTLLHPQLGPSPVSNETSRT